MDSGAVLHSTVAGYGRSRTTHSRRNDSLAPNSMPWASISKRAMLESGFQFGTNEARLDSFVLCLRQRPR